ncbi:MAG: hypothetical protein AABO58_04645 [Acidobacteriota bacterium]
MTRPWLMFLLVFSATGCESHPQIDAHVDAAGFFTHRYSRSPLSVWNVRGSAAGAGCDVLLVETSVVMNDAMVEALHYGAGAYGVVDGGVQRFYRDRAFRGVAYRDSAGHVWKYGGISRSEAETLRRCD